VKYSYNILHNKGLGYNTEVLNSILKPYPNLEKEIPHYASHCYFLCHLEKTKHIQWGSGFQGNRLEKEIRERGKKLYK
jgi:hypothetical protein